MCSPQPKLDVLEKHILGGTITLFPHQNKTDMEGMGGLSLKYAGENTEFQNLVTTVRETEMGKLAVQVQRAREGGLTNTV